MKKITLVILLFVGINCFAQKDPEAKELLDKVAEQIFSYKNITTDFDYLFENLAEEKSESYSGKLVIKGKKFRMDVDKTITFSNGKQRWVYLIDNNEVTISNIEISDDDSPEDRFMTDPLSLFTIYRDRFKYLLGDQEDIDGKTMQIVELSPENIKKPYFKIKYWFTPENNPYQLKCFLKDGTRYTLTLSKFAVNQKVDESELNFNAKNYTGVEVIDMTE